MEQDIVKTPVTVLDEMRNKIHLLNEASREINLRLSSKLDFLRGEKEKEESDTKSACVLGHINETNQTIDFLAKRITETDKLLNELFQLV